MLRDNLAGLIEPMLGSAAVRNIGCPGVHDSRAVRTAQHQSHRTIDPQCLENPRPEGAESTLPGNAAPPFPAEPRQPGNGWHQWISSTLAKKNDPEFLTIAVRHISPSPHSNMLRA